VDIQSYPIGKKEYSNSRVDDGVEQFYRAVRVGRDEKDRVSFWKDEKGGFRWNMEEERLKDALKTVYLNQKKSTKLYLNESKENVLLNVYVAYDHVRKTVAAWALVSDMVLFPKSPWYDSSLLRTPFEEGKIIFVDDHGRQDAEINNIMINASEIVYVSRAPGAHYSRLGKYLVNWIRSKSEKKPVWAEVTSKDVNTVWSGWKHLRLVNSTPPRAAFIPGKIEHFVYQ